MADQPLEDTGRNVKTMSRLGPLTQVDYAALNYFLSGRTLRSINEELGVGSQRLHSLLNRPSIKQLFASVKEVQKQSLEKDVELVVQAHRDLLTHADPNVRDRAIDKWYKVMGWYDNKMKLQLETGAEDIAKALMRGEQPVDEADSKLESDLAQEFNDEEA
jgi:hypothetical protein